MLRNLRPWPLVVPVVALAALAGCAASKPDLGPSLTETRDLLAEAERLAKGDAAAAYLTPARDLAAAGEGAAEKEPERAALLLEESRAASRAALAASDAERRHEDAENCLAQAADARREWQDAVKLLEQTEKVAGQEARGVERAPDEDVATDPLPAFPPSPADSLPAPALLETARAWTEEAKARDLSVADLENRSARAAAAREAPKAEPWAREIQGRLARWPVLEMAHRVEGDAWRDQCVTALERARRYASYRDHALFSMVELERGMKESARTQLEEERARQEERQKNLYESLKQFEGKFATIRQEARGTILSLSDILFDFGKDVLRREAEINLAKVAVILEQFPEMGISVEGHTDNVGSEEYNQKLSERRAEAVASFLAEQGVARERMQTHGYGMSQPVESNATDEGRQANRRVDLVIRES